MKFKNAENLGSDVGAMQRCIRQNLVQNFDERYGHEHELRSLVLDLIRTHRILAKPNRQVCYEIHSFYFGHHDFSFILDGYPKRETSNSILN